MQTNASIVQNIGHPLAQSRYDPSIPVPILEEAPKYQKGEPKEDLVLSKGQVFERYFA